MGTSSSKESYSEAASLLYSKRAGITQAPSSNSSISFLSSHLPNYSQCDDSGAPPPPPPPGAPNAPPPPPSVDGDNSSGGESSGDDDIARAAAMASAYTNPGPMEQATMDCKRLVALDTYDGFRCDVNKQLSPYMAVVHSFWLGTTMLQDGRKRTYTWLTQVADPESLYMARVDPERMSVDGRIHKAILGGLGMFKIQVGVSPEGQTDQTLAEIDFGAQTWTANLKYGSMGGGLVYGCNFYQAITPNLSMGGEGMYISANQNMVSNYLVRYTIPANSGDDDDVASTKAPAGPPGAPAALEKPSSTLCASFNPASASLTLNYKRIVTPNRVTLGAELECNPFSFESNAIVGGEFKLSRSKLQVSVDGNLVMKSTLESKLGKEPGQPSLTLTAELNHFDDIMRFGYGLSIDG